MDGVRITSAGEQPVAVRSVVPWFADEPLAGLDLVRGEADAEIGGGPQQAGVRLTVRRPAEVRGALTAKAPAGIKVTVPKETTVPRGPGTTVPVEVTVPAGTPAGDYQVPLSFGGEERTLTVRAYPRTAGPDLARAAGSVASSSGDETADFPAASAIDGDPKTRWSSPPRTAPGGSWNWPARRGSARSSCTGRTRTRRGTASRSRRTAAPGARLRRWAKAGAGARWSVWTAATPASSGSRAMRGPRSTATHCGRWRRTQ